MNERTQRVLVIEGDPVVRIITSLDLILVFPSAMETEAAS